MSTYEISKSSLLSLKAEILRKQQELVKAKADNDLKIKIIKKNTPLEIKNKGVESRDNKDLDEEDEDLLKKSRSMLEAKSKLYERLSTGKLSKEDITHNARFLVRFDKKNKSVTSNLPPSDSEDEADKYPESDEELYHSDDEANKDPGEKWVDYIDCLGRTRKCLQKDLAYLMSKDEELKKTVAAKKSNQLDNESDLQKKEETKEIDEEADETKTKTTQESELLSSDMRRELLRQQWEKEEEELRKKSDIHYQDILFGEARTHGVGYYGFSKDEEERAKQQEALKKLRHETEEKQKRAQELKATREKQLAARVKAAKNRRRARLGLPPEEEEPEPIPETEISEEEKRKQEELKRQEEEKEKLLEDARKHHIRPWDIGKDGVKEHYEMTQEEWVEKKRDERPEEFAPPSSYRKEFRSTIKNPEVEDADKSLKFTTKKGNTKKHFMITNKKPKRSINPYKTSNSAFCSNKGDTNKNEFYYGDRKGGSSSSVDDNELVDPQKSHQNTTFQPTPIINLCEETDFDDRLLTDYNKAMQNLNTDSSDDSEGSPSAYERGKGVEIAPPPSFEYYGPSLSKRPKISQAIGNIEDSIEAGLKYLRRQVEEKEKSTKHPREMFLA